MRSIRLIITFVAVTFSLVACSDTAENAGNAMELEPMSTDASQPAAQLHDADKQVTAVTPVDPGNPDLWSALHRPLRLPTMTDSGSCPWSEPRSVEYPDHSLVLGDGPVHVLWSWGAGVPYSDQTVDPKLTGVNLLMLWLTTPEYTEPFLVRGSRMDGSDDLRFYSIYDNGPETTMFDELRVGPEGIMTRVTETSTGWRQYPAGVLLPTPGCYAMQIDGTTFSSAFVFQVLSDASALQPIEPFEPPTSCATKFGAPEVRGGESGETGSYTAFWLDGDGISAGTARGVLFEGHNLVRWLHPEGTPISIRAERLDVAEPPLDVDLGPEGRSRWWPVDMVFPSSGCWRIIATSGESSFDTTLYVYPNGCRPEYLDSSDSTIPRSPCAPPE